MNLTIRLAAAAAAGVLAAGCGTTAGPPSASHPATPNTSAPASAPATTAAPSPAPAPVPFGYVPLFPFGNLAAVAPWEVVGTDDTTLTLDIPAYGGTATSPVRIAGKITGVDESLRAAVHQLGSSSPVGSYCCQPAGGQATPWSLAVPFHAASGLMITIVVHTGGHVAAVERFAVTGVRAG